MDAKRQCLKWTASAVVALMAIGAQAGEKEARMDGSQEVPPAQTEAKGVAKWSLEGDSFALSVKAEGMDATMAHVHKGAAGSNGPVLIPLAQAPDGTWKAPAGTKLDKEALDLLVSGRLYVNVHSEKFKGGEIRVQLSAP